MSSIYSAKTLGFYSLVQRVLGVPSALLGTAVSQVFFQRANADRVENGNSSEIFDRTLLRLLLVAMPVAFMLYMAAPFVFKVIFGAEWAEAGGYARILLPLFVLRFVSSPLSIILSVYEKQKQSLAINGLLLLQMASCFYLAKVFDLDIQRLLLIFSISGSLFYAAFIFYYRIVSRGS